MKTVKIEHEEAPDLGFLYGVILIDDRNLAGSKQATNLTVFAEGQVCDGAFVRNLKVPHFSVVSGGQISHRLRSHGKNGPDVC